MIEIKLQTDPLLIELDIVDIDKQKVRDVLSQTTFNDYGVGLAVLVFNERNKPLSNSIRSHIKSRDIDHQHAICGNTHMVVMRRPDYQYSLFNPLYMDYCMKKIQVSNWVESGVE